MMKLTHKGWIRVVAVFVFVILVGIYFCWTVPETTTSTVNFTAIMTDQYMAVVPIYNNLSANHRSSIVQTYAIPDEQYDLRIIAIVYNRAKSLRRLLDSLNKVDYENDNIKLEVWIDRSVDGSYDASTLEAAKSFNFEHGKYSLTIHPRHVGIYGQWLTTWKPKLNSSEIAVILEDDLTMSPHFYKYLKLVHKKYDHIDEINGYSLQGTSIKHYKYDTSLLVGPRDSHVFLYPVLGTWGFSPKTQNWMKFLDWFAKAHSNKSFTPIIPNNIVSSWYQEFIAQGKTEGIWSIWHIYHAWANREFTLYTNFRGHRGLSVNWKEPGLHYSTSDSKPSNLMLTEWKPEYEILPDVPTHLNIAGNKIIERPEFT